MRRLGIPLVLMAAAGALCGCSLLPGLGGTNDPDAVPLNVYLNMSGGFKSLTLSAPGAFINGNFTRVQFLDSAATDVVLDATEGVHGEFTNSGSTIGINAIPEVPFPPAGGSGTIEMSTDAAGIKFASSAGKQITLFGPVFIQYTVDSSGRPGLPTAITELVLPAEGAPASKLRLAMSGMAPSTSVQLRLGYESSDTPGTLTLNGTAVDGALTLTASDDTAVTSLTTVTMTFNAP